MRISDWSSDVCSSDLEAKLYGAAGVKPGRRRLPAPDWAAVHRGLKRKHVTLQTLWEEYIEAHPDGYRYSRYCDLYRGWEGRLPVTMRQTHLAGDKLFVDYAGDKLGVVIARRTGEGSAAHIFVAVMGASSLSLARKSVVKEKRGVGQSGHGCCREIINTDDYTREYTPTRQIKNTQTKK